MPSARSMWRAANTTARRRVRHCASLTAAQHDAMQLTRARAEESVLKSLVRPLPHSSEAVDDVRSFGVARIAAALSDRTASVLCEEVLDQLAHAQEHLTGFDDGEEGSHFSAVLGAAGSEAAIAEGDETRWDVRLQLSLPVQAALHELLRGPVGDALEELAGGTARLHELAAVVSAPGAVPQVLHPDADWSGAASVFSAFVALHDVPAELGPTLFLRGTHTEEAHVAHAAGVAATSGRRDEVAHCYRAFLAAADARAAVLRCGEASVYDRRLLHAGGRNASDVARVQFYVTFARVDVEGADVWNAYSIRTEYRDTMRLARFRDV